MTHTPTRIRRRRLGAFAAASSLLLLPLAACSDDAADAAEPAVAESTGPAAGAVSAAQALEEDRIAIDVRTPEEHALGHVDGAALIDFQSAAFPDQIADLDPDGAYVVYCRSGNRSAQAAAAMRELGLDVLDGGALTDMEAAGWPVAA